MANKAREELLSLLDQKAFEPVLNASPERYSNEDEKRKLKNAQATTRSTQRRYHQKYESAEEVRKNFKRDLHSEAALEVQSDLRDLGLPTLQDIEPEFEHRADQLGVGS